MGKIEIDHTGSGGGITLSSDGTDLLLDGSAVGGGGGASSNTGTGNFIGGTDAGAALQSGAEYNTLLGNNAGNDVTTGDQNTAIGRDAMSRLTTGSRNVAIGVAAATYFNADDNVAIGNTALYGNVSTFVTGSSNVAIGRMPGRDITSGSNNVMIGNEAGNNLSLIHISEPTRRS